MLDRKASRLTNQKRAFPNQSMVHNGSSRPLSRSHVKVVACLLAGDLVIQYLGLPKCKFDFWPNHQTLNDSRSCQILQVVHQQTRQQTFAVFQGTSNGGQRVSNLRTRVNRRSDLPYDGTMRRFDRLFLKNWQPPLEVPWKIAKTACSSCF
jgi:hypothetical protein